MKFIIILALAINLFAQDVIRVGISLGFAPFAYKKDDVIVGFDIDLVNEIAKKADLKVQFIPMDFDALIAAVKLGKIDVIASGLSKTPQRAKNVEFSDEYFNSENYFLKLKSNSSINNISDLDSKIIGVQVGSIQADELKYIKNPKAFLNSEVPNIILALVSNKIDAVIVDEAVAKGYMKNYPELEVFAKKSYTSSGACFAFKKGNFKLRDKFNEALKSIKNNEIYQKLLDKYEM